MSMPDFEQLAGDDCPPGLNCPKIGRRAPGTVAIVGVQITDQEVLDSLGVGPGEAAVEVTESLYRDGHAGLEGRPV